MIPTNVKRPRNVDWNRAAAILYGYCGTSKAYVIGLAFAVAGYSSFWLIAAMCVLTALVGLNYMVICRLYPDGGGVYASVRHRSEVISIVGAFLLIADYLVTAAISALSAFQYLGVPHPEKFAAASILAIGLLNLLGPKQTGGLAFLISIPTAIVVVVLGLFSLPHLGTALGHLQPLHGTFGQNWAGFVGIVLALSGVEAIANATGVMKLDRGSSDEKPSVVKTSTPAILIVMIEVCLFTALLGLAMHALSGLQIVNGDVNAPGAEGVRDYMLRYMGQIFVGSALGPALGHVFGFLVSIVFGLLLLSAVNTAVVDLIAIQFLMSRDREIPKIFQRLNKWGVPSAGMLLATLVPMLLVIVVKRYVWPGRSLCCWRGWRDSNQSRRHLDRSEIVDQELGAHAHVRNFYGNGCDRNLAAHRQTECALFCRHDSRCWIDPSRTCAGTPNEKGSCARAVATTIRCRCCASDVQSASSFRGRSNPVRGSQRRPHARFRVARSSQGRLASLPALRARTTVHDRRGCQAQMAARSGSQHHFR